MQRQLWRCGGQGKSLLPALIADPLPLTVFLCVATFSLMGGGY